MANYKKAARLFIPLAGGLVIGRLTAKAQEDYKDYKTPPFSPPPAAFPVVWPALYTVMGVAYNMAYESKKDDKLTKSHYTQLALNYAWSILYFNLKLRGTALIESYCLLAAAIVAAVQFYEADKKAGLMMIPYVMWLSYATYLNGGNWLLNRDDEDYSNE
ncbi:tryptophan-rich sensory protein [Macrococcus hajekii]|uniref:Tryptophan-rich sensory protein n=1 Tax=Macrococcus hajekii TaxID=198482 RepID=A0A4R6BJS1_9STAP|nr:TspO/MBR family protein [Macrococcus hajekii]TDM01973.1 tryptophan-rich sensory protein [Macrococcus hajekii]GGB08966.1 tryptophan-rich sensory protein [Macrococcus hajekii]